MAISVTTGGVSTDDVIEILRSGEVEVIGDEDAGIIFREGPGTTLDGEEIEVDPDQRWIEIYTTHLAITEITEPVDL